MTRRLPDLTAGFTLQYFTPSNGETRLTLKAPRIYTVFCCRCGHDQMWCECPELLTSLLRIPILHSQR